MSLAHVLGSSAELEPDDRRRALDALRIALLALPVQGRDEALAEVLRQVAMATGPERRFAVLELRDEQNCKAVASVTAYFLERVCSGLPYRDALEALYQTAVEAGILTRLHGTPPWRESPRKDG